jgi:non-ribosomal peptide synthetase component F
LHELFEQQAEAHSDSIALVCAGQPMTYGELERRANRLARFLGGRGVQRGDCVGLWLERSTDAYVRGSATWLSKPKRERASVVASLNCLRNRR